MSRIRTTEVPRAVDLPTIPEEPVTDTPPQPASRRQPSTPDPEEKS